MCCCTIISQNGLVNFFKQVSCLGEWSLGLRERVLKLKVKRYNIKGIKCFTPWERRYDLTQQ